MWGKKEDETNENVEPVEVVTSNEGSADITVEISMSEEPMGAAAEPAESSHGSDDEGEPEVWLQHPLGSPTVLVKGKVDIDNKKSKGWREVEAPK